MANPEVLDKLQVRVKKSSSVLEEISQHPTDLAYISSGLLGLANRPKNIGIHLAVPRVRFYLLRFNSSGNFCDGGTICSRGTA